MFDDLIKKETAEKIKKESKKIAEPIQEKINRIWSIEKHEKKDSKKDSK